ncbi:MAG TPA: ABC transporter ATP-binding protein [Actinomycetota bacterium]|nr:ABC transporter ATP-binding protein [Actinomycetota bacterium]
MSVLLSVEDLTVAYGKIRAVDGVSLVVPRGSVVALLGPNGAGKSSLLRAIAGLAPREGRIVLGGEPIHDLPAHAIARRGLCSIPEGRGVFGALTVAENLRMASTDDRDWTARVVEAFPILGERMGQQAATLSGGEQQMLALARAVASEAPLVTIDEPSLGLAPKMVGAIYAAIRRMRERHRTVLLVEQYAAQALPVADLVAVMAHGRIEFFGEPGELAYAPPLVEQYLGRITA